MRVLVALLLVLMVLAPIPMVTPALAQAACTTWVAEEWEDEGGPVLTAAACALDDERVFLSVTCNAGTLAIRHDLPMGAERSASYDERAMVEFASEGASVTLDMGYEDMDGKFAAYLTPDAPVVGLLTAGKELVVRDAAGIYPSRTFSLTGSSAALKALTGKC